MNQATCLPHINSAIASTIQNNPNAYGRTSCEKRMWIGETASSSAAIQPARSSNQRRVSGIISATVAVPASTRGRRQTHSLFEIRSRTNCMK